MRRHRTFEVLSETELKHLEPDRTPPEPALLPYVTRGSVFYKTVGSLATNKAPGPDEIPNEVLRRLPARLKQAIHKLFILMWHTRCTPADWKTSNTVLIYKKKDPTDPRTTTHINTVVTTYMEQYGLLYLAGGIQEGPEHKATNHADATYIYQCKAAQEASGRIHRHL